MSSGAGSPAQHHPLVPAARRVALVGTRMIGGSLLLALRRAGALASGVGYDPDAARARRARERSIVDELAPSAAAAAAGADLVVLATPVGAAEQVLVEIAAALGPACLVIDVGLTKAGVVAAAERILIRPERFVACHPIAGTERSGPDAADAEMFRGRPVLIATGRTTAPEAIEAVEALWSSVGARTMRIDPALHDAVLGVVSHLPHAAAFALAGAVDRILDDDVTLGARAAGLAGGGFVDTTRIAASDPAMWRDVFVDNRDRLLPLLDVLVAELGALREAVARGDGAGIVALVERARRGRARVLGGGA